MTYPLRPAAGVAASHGSGLARPEAYSNAQPNAYSNGRSQRAMPLTRNYEIAYLSRNNTLCDATRIAPLVPAFEEAFSAFARGTLISTPTGPVAIEDLCPGDIVTTGTGPQPLRWRGSISLVPDRARNAPLSRIPADSFGPQRPSDNLLLGDSARIFASKSISSMSSPANWRDGETAIEVRPVAPVPLYHLVFDCQEIFQANDLEVASYHPDHSAYARPAGSMAQLFLGMFPHLRDLDGFGASIRDAPDRFVA